MPGAVTFVDIPGPRSVTSASAHVHPVSLLMLSPGFGNDEMKSGHVYVLTVKGPPRTGDACFALEDCVQPKTSLRRSMGTGLSVSDMLKDSSKASPPRSNVRAPRIRCDVPISSVFRSQYHSTGLALIAVDGSSAASRP